ncbi:O-antigen polymerase [Metabacillus herbersteinensis]|uniref:O-antigen polymerase n=1 Tax=Metabacillus herbersteinensis TaxID=283816 RepID=A0ABV6GF24_9BACI
MYIGFTSHPDLRHIYSERLYLITFLCTSYVLLSLPLFIIMFNKIWRIDPKILFIKYLDKPLKPTFSINDKYIYYPLWVITILSFFITIYLLIGSPLLDFLLGKSVNISQSRIEYSRGSGGSELIRGIFGNGFLPLCSYIAYSYMKMYKKFQWKIMFFILFVNSALIYGASMSKSAIAFYILSFILLKVLIEGKISNKQIINSAIIVTSVVLLMYIVTNENFIDLVLDYETLIFGGGPIGRMIFGQLVGFVNTLNVFPEYHSFLFGADFAFLRFLGMDFIDSARVVMTFVNPAGIERGTVGVMNSLFIAEAYANFGYIGIAFAPFIVALILQFFTLLLYKLPKTPLVTGWWIYIMFLFSQGITGGLFSEFIFNTRVIGVTFLTILLYFSGHILHSIFGRKL